MPIIARKVTDIIKVAGAMLGPSTIAVVVLEHDELKSLPFKTPFCKPGYPSPPEFRSKKDKDKDARMFLPIRIVLNSVDLLLQSSTVVSSAFIIEVDLEALSRHVVDTRDTIRGQMTGAQEDEAKMADHCNDTTRS